MWDSFILWVRNSVILLSLFDDYAHRGPSLANMCLYDYISLVYKSTNQGGIPFDPTHPQYATNRQFIRKETEQYPHYSESFYSFDQTRTTNWSETNISALSQAY